MAKQKAKRTNRSKARKPAAPRAPDQIFVRRVPGQRVFELVHPPCAQQRREDMEEVRTMLEAGEVDIAVDELRWLLGGCRALLEAHQLLGEIALAENDLPLARGHFGYAFKLGTQALPKRGLSGVLPADRPANRALFKSAEGLARCLVELGKPDQAAEVVQKFLALDPADPLNLKSLLKNADT